MRRATISPLAASPVSCRCCWRDVDDDDDDEDTVASVVALEDDADDGVIVLAGDQHTLLWCRCCGSTGTTT